MAESRDLVLRVTNEQAILLHQLLRRAEDLAMQGDDFERLGQQGTYRKEFLNLQVNVEEIFNIATRMV